MYWLVIAVVIIVAAAIAWGLKGGDATTIPPDERIEVEELEEYLAAQGVDLDSTQNPDPAILQPHIASDDELLGAIEGRRDGKSAYLVALPDRLVAGEATLGTMGAEVRTLRFADIDSFDQSYEIGGEFHLQVGPEKLSYTHIPRSRTREFAELVRQRIAANQN